MPELYSHSCQGWIYESTAPDPGSMGPSRDPVLRKGPQLPS